MSDPALRAKILSEDPKTGSTFPLFHRLSFAHMFRFGNPPNYEPKREDSIEASAAREGRAPQELAYDILLEDDGRGLIYTPISNYANYDLSASEGMLANRNTIMGLGDGGAHVGFILDAGYPTWLITHWNKKRQRFSLPETIRRLTSDTAGAAGLHDRGVIARGKKADLNVIDYDRIGFGRPYVVHDLPAGGKRLMQKAEGYTTTVVSGQVTFRDGEATENLPGKLVRGQRAE
jgi:N-acyl-D-aspartate/D-glutamate deacylase